MVLIVMFYQYLWLIDFIYGTNQRKALLYNDNE